MRHLVLALSVLAAGCEGNVGDPGVYEDPTVVITDPNGPRVLAFSCDATAVNAKVPVSCTIQATHTGGGAVTCTLDPGDGQAALNLGDCANPRNASVRFSNPGRTTLTLTVTDDLGRTSTRTVIIDVTGQPNQAPLLADLKAAPASGAIPFKTTLTWTASDPDGDALSCAVDIGADGSVEYPGVDCAKASQVIDVRTMGTIPVKLVVTDERGLSAEATITLTTREPTGDVRIAGVDFGQSVVKADLKLVEGKPALIRVAVVANEPNLTTSVEVEAKKGATVIGKQQLTGPSPVPTAVTEGDLTKYFRFVMPAEWITPGVELSIKVDPADELGETDETNNARTLAPSIGRGNVVHLTAVPVTQSGLTGVVRDIKKAVTDVWPAKDLEVKTRAPYTFSGTLTGSNPSAWSTLLNELAQVRAADGSERNYYGWVKVNYGSGVAGIGFIGQGTATGRDDSLDTAAHELGHNFGRPHAPCGGVAGADPSYPYAGAKIGSWGWDGTKLLAPQSYVDLMSYCSPEWVSDYNYQRVQQFMETNQEFAPGAMLPDLRFEDSVLLAGRLTAGGAELAPVQRLRAAPSKAIEGDATVVLLTTSGQELRVPVRLVENAEGDGELQFATVAKDPGPLAQLSLVVRGAVVAKRAALGPVAAKASVSRVDANSVRVRWSGAQFAAVAHVGDERTTLAVNASTGEVVLRTDGLAGGELEVSVSDGVRSDVVRLPMP